MEEIAAGGVVFHRQGCEIEVLLILDRYGRWTLPKGKQEPGETVEETALREIKEETGVRGRILSVLEKVHYIYYDRVRGKIDKSVTYYLVEAVSTDVTAQVEEIDAAKWFPLAEAAELHRTKGYDNNQSVVKEALQLLEGDES
ncbi:NUDIX hydrolase [Mechercharimyces sp. CAU 1602]|uniref:NUDIX hydrolase n=1 Tax=Mechercharimyces sp. CAU 1602 TaxID=2973933 RepID=UPI0021617929|nr:NUDIX hydrolase [Mechercharimyces sp. CAU 1602]MCS1350453.1 NUDIX hydrolase [Mechercharimyces sp. CAU 1602]